MSFLETLAQFFRRPLAEQVDDIPEGVCPNCWGWDEYGGEVHQRMKDRQINVNNHQEYYAFIQDFAVNHVDGIRLRNHNARQHCPTCKAYYG